MYSPGQSSKEPVYSDDQTQNDIADAGTLLNASSRRSRSPSIRFAYNDYFYSSPQAKRARTPSRAQEAPVQSTASSESAAPLPASAANVLPKKRGRPAKQRDISTSPAQPAIKRKVGRPRKLVAVEAPASPSSADTTTAPASASNSSPLGLRSRAAEIPSGSPGAIKRKRGRPPKLRSAVSNTLSASHKPDFGAAAPVGSKRELLDSEEHISESTGESLADGQPVVKRRPGRPRKVISGTSANQYDGSQKPAGATDIQVEAGLQPAPEDGVSIVPKKKRGRPPKNKVADQDGSMTSGISTADHRHSADQNSQHQDDNVATSSSIVSESLCHSADQNSQHQDDNVATSSSIVSESLPKRKRGRPPKTVMQISTAVATPETAAAAPEASSEATIPTLTVKTEADQIVHDHVAFVAFDPLNLT